MGVLRDLWKKAKKNAGDTFTKGTGDKLDKFETNLQNLRKAIKAVRDIAPHVDSDWQAIFKILDDHLKGLKNEKADTSGFVALGSAVTRLAMAVSTEMVQMDKELVDVIKTMKKRLDD